MKSARARLKKPWSEPFQKFNAYPEIVQGVFYREGGVSSSPFDSFNVADNVGDLLENVRENRKRLLEHLGVTRSVYLSQVHGTKLVLASLEERAIADAVFTQERGLALCITHADCQAAIFYDPKTRIIAALHAGWRGIVQEIYPKVLKELETRVGCLPQDWIVGISPSICGTCHERRAYRSELPKPLWEYQVRPNYFDFRNIAKDQLLASGVLEKNLEISLDCTCCEEDRFFSYRREGETGRCVTVIAIKGKTV